MNKRPYYYVLRSEDVWRVEKIGGSILWVGMTKEEKK
jgi:hypothetical protein